MFARVRTIFHQEIRGLHEAAYLVGAATLASQLLALVRDRLLAATFGAGSELDIYYAAFRIPDLVYATIASFVSVNVLIPMLVKELRDDTGVSPRGQAFMQSVSTVFCAVMVVVCGVLFFAMPYLAPYVAPGFDSTMMERLIQLSRILLLSPFLLGLSNIAGSATQTLRRYVVYAMSPVLYNAGIIFGVLVLYRYMGLAGLAWGVVCGALMHVAVQFPLLYLHRVMPWMTSSINWADIKNVVILSFPRTFALACGQCTFVALTAIASQLGSGAISMFSFAYNLQSVPLAIVGVSYSVVAFPVLSELFTKGNREQFFDEISRAARHIVFWSLPIAALFIALRDEIVGLLLGVGRFTASDTGVVSLLLACFVASLVGQSLTLLVVRGYYAAQKTARPLVINVVASLLTVGIAYFLWKNVGGVCDMTGICHFRLVLLPVAFSIGWLCNAFFLWTLFRRDFAVQGRYLSTMLLSAGVAACGAYFGARVVVTLAGNSLPLVVKGVGAALFGVVCAGFLYALMRSSELREIVAKVRAH